MKYGNMNNIALRCVSEFMKYIENFDQRLLKARHELHE